MCRARAPCPSGARRAQRLVRRREAASQRVTPPASPRPLGGNVPWLGQARRRAPPTLCNTGSSAPGRARHAACASTNRWVAGKPTRDRRTSLRQKTHELSEGLRDLGRFLVVSPGGSPPQHPINHPIPQEGDRVRLPDEGNGSGFAHSPRTRRVRNRGHGAVHGHERLGLVVTGRL